jgi:hypothetical protein
MNINLHFYLFMKKINYLITFFHLIQKYLNFLKSRDPGMSRVQIPLYGDNETREMPSYIIICYIKQLSKI